MKTKFAMLALLLMSGCATQYTKALRTECDRLANENRELRTQLNLPE